MNALIKSDKCHLKKKAPLHFWASKKYGICLLVLIQIQHTHHQRRFVVNKVPLLEVAFLAFFFLLCCHIKSLRHQGTHKKSYKKCQFINYRCNLSVYCKLIFFSIIFNILINLCQICMFIETKSCVVFCVALQWTKNI